MEPNCQPAVAVFTNLYNPVWIGDAVLGIGIAFFIFLVASIVWITKHDKDTHKNRAVSLGAIFALAPPLYFFFEIFLFREWGVHTQWEQFKYLQETSAKLWAAGLAVLYAVYAKNFPSKS